jgi:hypothetical protein
MPPHKRARAGAGAGDGARTLELYHNVGGARIELRVYVGTPADELVAMIREMLGLRGQLRFRDDTGILVVLSSHFPDGTRLHVTEEAGLPPPLPPRRLAFAGGAVAPAAQPGPAAAAAAAYFKTWGGGATASTASDLLQYPPLPYTVPSDLSWEFTCTANRDTSSASAYVVDAKHGGCEPWYALSSAIPVSRTAPPVLVALVYGSYTVNGETGCVPCCSAVGIVDSAHRTLPYHPGSGKGAPIFSAAYPCMISAQAVFSEQESTTFSDTVRIGPLTRTAQEVNTPYTVGVLIDPSTASVVFYEYNSVFASRPRFRLVLDSATTSVRVAVHAPKHGARCILYPANLTVLLDKEMKQGLELRAINKVAELRRRASEKESAAAGSSAAAAQPA